MNGGSHAHGHRVPPSLNKHSSGVERVAPITAAICDNNHRRSKRFLLGQPGQAMRTFIIWTRYPIIAGHSRHSREPLHGICHCRGRFLHRFIGERIGRNHPLLRSSNCFDGEKGVEHDALLRRLAQPSYGLQSRWTNGESINRQHRPPYSEYRAHVLIRRSPTSPSCVACRCPRSHTRGRSEPPRTAEEPSTTGAAGVLMSAGSRSGSSRKASRRHRLPPQ